MTTREEELLAEIAVLKRKLENSSLWMKRQVQESIKVVATERVKKFSRHTFQNNLERDQLVLLESSIENCFGSLLLSAPPKTVERLIDAELQWFTLQKYPQMDGAAMSMSYQKIFDASVEMYIAEPFRQYVRQNKILLRNQLDSLIEEDVENVIYKGYNLSSGRLYQIILEIKKENSLTPFLALFQKFLQIENKKMYDTLLGDDFLLPFQAIIEMEIFSKKRHEKKVSFIEAKKTRAIMVGNLQVKNSLLGLLFMSNRLV